MSLCFCRAQCLVARLNTSVHSVIGTIPICPACEHMKPHTEGTTGNGAMCAVKDFNLLQTCVVTWRSIRELLSSNVTSFAAVSFVMNVIARNI